MSKAVYVMDEMPTNCPKCLLTCNHETFGIGAKRPDDCPLKEMPEYIKPDKKQPSEADVAYVAGWNACLDELGGTDD